MRSDRCGQADRDRGSRRPLLGAAVLALAMCSSGLLAFGQSANPGVTTINGQVPPGKAMPAQAEELVQSGNGAGSTVYVYRTTRAAGTRAPIHVHDYGGTTCMLEGEMTLFMEGTAPHTAHSGECYWMPPGEVMTGVNTGKTDAVFYDVFTVPEGQPVWRVIESGNESEQFDPDHE